MRTTVAPIGLCRTMRVVMILAIFFLAFTGIPNTAHGATCGPNATVIFKGNNFLGSAVFEATQPGPAGSEQCDPTTEQKNAAFKSNKSAEGKLPSGIDCSATKDYWFNLPTCLLRAGFSWIGASFIWIGVTLATIAGGLFEWAITHTIVKFAEYIQIIRPAIDAGWTALRDIANIVIIGLFVFIAINIILGVKEFGEKKAVAHVLIIAVLINFSLLFTKIIVDASNFTAYQFYNLMIKGIAPQEATAAGVKLGASSITGSFMKFLGTEGISDSADKLKKISDNNDNALWALAYGLLGLIFLLAVSAVFLYGAFLVISRAVLIVFLMLTSALAFASWLIPHQFISDGWMKWWKSLLKSAFFAPILMAFLWMTLRVSQGLSEALVTKGPGAGGTLGALAEKASSEANIVALLNFALILGLLYAAIATANMFSKTISGFRLATGLTALPLTAGSRFLAAPFLRQTAGWLGYAYERRRLDQARGLRDQAAQARRMEMLAQEKGQIQSAKRFGAIASRFEARADTKLKRAARGGALAESRMNVMDSGLMQSAAKAAGAGFIGESTRGTKGYAGQMKARTEAAEKEAAKIAPSGAQNEQAKRQVKEQREMGLRQLQATRDAERANADAVKQFEQLGQKLVTAQQNMQTEESDASANKVRIDEAYRAGAINQAQHTAQMSVEDDRISRARRAVQLIQQRIDILDRPVKDAAKAIEEYEKKTEQIGKEVVAAMGESAENIAERVGRRSGDVLTRAAGKITGANEIVAQETRALYKNRRRTADLRDVIASMQPEATQPRPVPTPPPTATP